MPRRNFQTSRSEFRPVFAQVMRESSQKSWPHRRTKWKRYCAFRRRDHWKRNNIKRSVFVIWKFFFFFCKRKKNFYRINYFRGLPFGGGFLCSSINLKISRKSFFILAAMCCGRMLRVSCSYEKKKNDEKKKKETQMHCSEIDFGSALY